MKILSKILNSLPFIKRKKKKPLAWILGSAIIILLLAWIAVGYLGSRVERLGYEVLESRNGYEVRLLSKHIRAETTIDGSFDSAGGEAFRILAGYIFGGNKKQQQIAMTAPVIENESEVIAMTAPVISQENGAERKFSFVLPSKYQLNELPEPLDDRIEFREVLPQKVAVLRFRGGSADKNIENKKELLRKYLQRDDVKYGKIYFAGYNPPWTPPFMRRLEIWAELN